MGTPIATSDLTWLLMDRPSNRMHIHGMLWFDTCPDWDVVQDVMTKRLPDRYSTFRQRARRIEGVWEWVDVRDFDPTSHFHRHTVEDLTFDALQPELASRFREELVPYRPLWWVDFFNGEDPAQGGALFIKCHHALADGLRLVQVLLGMNDEGIIPNVPKATERRGKVSNVLSFGVKAGSDVLDFAMGTALATPRRVAKTLNPLKLSRNVADSVDMARHPTRITDAVTDVASVENLWVNSVREVSRMVLGNRAKTEAWHGHPRGDKAISWVLGIDLAEIKLIRGAFGGTVNDVLLALVSKALTNYLRDHHDSHANEAGWLVPVALQPMDPHAETDKLGNHFAVVLFSMPLGIDDDAELITEIQRRTTRIKHSAVPGVAFGVQWAIGESPKQMARAVTEFFANKSVGQLTNVPGPRQPLHLAGYQVSKVVAWVPMTADQSLGVCIFSYNGEVTIGVSADLGLVEHPQQISEAIQEHLAKMSAAARAAFMSD